MNTDQQATVTEVDERLNDVCLKTYSRMTLERSKTRDLIRHACALIAPFVEDGKPLQRGEMRDLLQQLRDRVYHLTPTDQL